jgi:hypothetical protein
MSALTSTGSTRAWRRTREWVFLVKGRRCYLCGAYAGTIDHVVPRCDGGGDELSNLEPCCARHNSERSMRRLVERRRLFGGTHRLDTSCPRPQPKRARRGEAGALIADRG